jgi:hypothetical protein
MNSQGPRPRFLLLPEVGERPGPAPSKQTVLRRYSLSRLPAEPVAEKPERRFGQRRPA